MLNRITALWKHIYGGKNNETKQLKLDFGLYIIASLICLGVIFYQFITREGLWGDELALANHYFENWKNMFAPLQSHQVAPVLFLLIEKSLLSIANATQTIPDYWLRLYPFLCGIGVLFLYYPTIKKYGNSSTIALFSALFLFFTPQFIYYTSEVKQYICELFCCILLLYIYKYKTDTTKYTLLFCLCVLFCILTSHMVCFSLLALGIYDTILLLKKYKLNIKKWFVMADSRQYMIRYTICLLLLFGYYFYFLSNHPTRDFMLDWWKEYFFTTDNARWLLETNLKNIYPQIPYVFLIYIIGLICLLFLKDKLLFTYAFCVMGGHMLFSYFQLYPIYRRLILYWQAVIALLFGCTLYMTLKLLLFPLFRKYAGYMVSLLGFCIISFYFISLDFKIPFYLHRSSYKLVYDVLNTELESDDFVMMYKYGFNKYTRTYYYKNLNKLQYESFHYAPDVDKALVKLQNKLKDADNFEDYINSNKYKDPNISKIIAYTILNPQFQQYKRIWLVLLEQHQDMIKNDINNLIERASKKMKIEKCQTFFDTTMCLLINIKDKEIQ